MLDFFLLVIIFYFSISRHVIIDGLICKIWDTNHDWWFIWRSFVTDILEIIEEQQSHHPEQTGNYENNNNQSTVKRTRHLEFISYIDTFKILYTFFGILMFKYIFSKELFYLMVGCSGTTGSFCFKISMIWRCFLHPLAPPHD